MTEQPEESDGAKADAVVEKLLAEAGRARAEGERHRAEANRLNAEAEKIRAEAAVTLEPPRRGRPGTVRVTRYGLA
jgi:hypothetical protein